MMPSDKPAPESYLRVASGVYIKALEELYVYDARSDELYEINEATGPRRRKICAATRSF